MTKGQIITFLIIARCCFAKWAVLVGTMGITGDPEFESQKRGLILANSYMKALKCYDPDAENNCLTSDEIFDIINRLSEILGLCGDPLSLTESNSDCCNVLNGVTILNP